MSFVRRHPVVTAIAVAAPALTVCGSRLGPEDIARSGARTGDTQGETAAGGVPTDAGVPHQTGAGGGSTGSTAGAAGAAGGTVAALAKVEDWTSNGLHVPRQVGARTTYSCASIIQLEGDTWSTISGPKPLCGPPINAGG